MRCGAILLGLAIAFSSWSLPGVAWGNGKASDTIRKKAAQTFDEARINITDSQRRQELATVAKAKACQEAQESDRALGKAQHDDPGLAKLAQASIDKDQACELAERSEKEAIQLYRATKTLFRAIAADLDDCGKPDTECTAQKHAELVGLLAAPREPHQSNPKEEAKRLAKLDDALIKFAASAQKRTAEQRAHAAVAYMAQDPLLASALATKAADDKSPRGAEIREGTSAVLEAVPELRSAARDAQIATNQLVRHAATLLKPCEKEPDPAACSRQQAAARQSGAEALARMEAQLAAAQQAQDRLKKGAALADAGIKWSRAEDRRAEIRFAALLDTYADARSMLGDSSALRLTAGAADGTATLKLAVGRALPSGFRSTTVILTTPTDDKGYTRFSSVDGLSRASSIEIGLKDLYAFSMTDNLLRQSGASIKLGVQPHSYIKSLDPKEEVTENYKHWALSTYSAFYQLKAINPSVHILKLQVQRTMSDDTAETRCPIVETGSTSATVTCATGSFKPLEPEWRTLLSYQLRLKGEKFGLAPVVTYSARKDRRWEVELPVFFVPADGKDASLSAGLKLNWTNKPGEGKSKARVGLFVGSTFDFWGAPE